MKSALQSYSPLVRRLNYDALAGREGCEAVTGNTWFNFLDFTTFCVFSHSQSPWHNVNGLVRYFPGPATHGTAVRPYSYQWTAWQATVGLRFGRVGTITPPANSTGSASVLFPTYQTTWLHAAFDNQALLHIAVRKSATQIELRWHTTLLATSALIFTGHSPVLFNGSSLGGIEENTPELALYYLKASDPYTLFGRFSAEDYATERIVLDAVRVQLASLTAIRARAGQIILYGRDVDGRNVTFKTPILSRYIEDEQTTGFLFANGSINDAFAEAEFLDEDITQETSFLFVNGRIQDLTVTPDHYDDANIEETSFSFESGEIETL